MERDLEKLIARLNLSEEEKGEVSIENDVPGVLKVRQANTLIGSMYTKKSYNVAAMKKTLLSLWKCEVQDLGENKFLFEFQDESDKHQVLCGEPWTFDSHLMCLKEFDPSQSVSSMTFDSVNIWVQIHNLPLGCMTKKVGEELGARIGRVVRVDTDALGCGWGEYLRVRVRMNLADPLKRVAFVRCMGSITTVLFRYERLPSFCFGCGRIGHADRECPRVIHELLTHKAATEFGPWLRASKIRFVSKSGGPRGEVNDGSTIACGEVEKGNNLLDRGMKKSHEDESIETVLGPVLDKSPPNEDRLVSWVEIEGGSGEAGLEVEKGKVAMVIDAETEVTNSVAPAVIGSGLKKSSTWKRMQGRERVDVRTATGMVSKSFDGATKRKGDEGARLSIIDIKKRARLGNEESSVDLTSEAASAE